MQQALGITDVEPCGSVGVKCARIVEGRRDLYVHPVPYMKEWDTCAPEVIVREAGGVVSDCLGAASLQQARPAPAARHPGVRCQWQEAGCRHARGVYIRLGGGADELAGLVHPAGGVGHGGGARPRLVAPVVAVLGADIVLLVAGVITPAQAFAGFSNPAPITVAALFVLAARWRRRARCSR